MNVFRSVSVILFVSTLPLLAAVTGTVRDDAGAPVAGAFVRFVDDAALETHTLTDSLGRYSLELPSGVGTADRSAGRISSPLSLSENFPNPFSERTRLSFTAPDAGAVTFSVFDVGGRLVKKWESTVAAGRHTTGWDRTDRQGRKMSDGVYCFEVRRGDVCDRRFMVVSRSGAGNPGAVQAETRSPRLSKRASKTCRVIVYGKGIFPIDKSGVSLADGETREWRSARIDLWETCRAILRDDFSNCRYRFEVERAGRVAFLGGSITNNKGWRDSTMSFLRKKFPAATFDFIEAGIPSMGSNYHAFRMEKDVFFKGRVDLLFLESAVNDTGLLMTPLERMRATEGIVRQARSHNPAIDIIQMHFAHDLYYPYVKAGVEIPSVADYEKSGVHYGLSMINDAMYVAENYTWKQFGENVHPGRLGQGIYARAIRNLLDAAWKEPSPQNSAVTKHFHPVTQIDDESWTQGHIVAIDSAHTGGGFTRIASWKPSDKAKTREGFVRVPVLQATKAGATTSLTFTGTVIGFIQIAGPDAGMVEVSIDGKLVDTVDLFRYPNSQNLHLPTAMVFSLDSPMATHTLTLEILSSKNPKSKGHACRIAHFLVNGP